VKNGEEEADFILETHYEDSRPHAPILPVKQRRRGLTQSLLTTFPPEIAAIKKPASRLGT